MKELHKRENATQINVEPNAGIPYLLCSNESSKGIPALDFLDTSADNVSEDMILDYLARIISEIYLSGVYEHSSNEKGSDILPSINEGTS